ncbi:protein RESISTANCE TO PHYTOPHTHORA 1, chloroplastic isoform X2 [Malania oleifera]|uniref:protein RESISTANCE TO PHYTOPHTHORA 1, chloroplastic isoform X2 n=1 Tax=Malania oleifera TaxID=397392 RepID=UPI0025AE8A4A|nr:protein RESISTANCE TO PHYTOPHTHORA 1, chloroplastic isoform X2 [Malania oleifera]
MTALASTPLCNFQISNPPSTFSIPRNSLFSPQIGTRRTKILVNSNEADAQTVEERKDGELETNGASKSKASASSVPAIDRDLKKAVQKTAATFAPRASTATKNPATPGTALYTVFEVQGYASMLLGGALSFNLIFPSNEPDIWRLMGMWSIWMFKEE